MSKNFLRDYFNFSKKELNGIFILMLLIVLFLLFPFLYPAEPFQKAIDIAQFKKEITEFEQSGLAERSYSYRDVKTPGRKAFAKPSYFLFDPNHLPDADWQKLGLSAKQIRIIKNYEAKGGKFYRKEDVQKMYVISPQTYQKLEPYIRIDVEKLKPNSPKKTAGPTLSIIELNQADSVQLQGIRGIGPAFASRIIRYRDRLGGFYHKEQLREIYGLDSTKFIQISPQINIAASAIKKININAVVFDDLKRHPYLNYKQLNAILQYRKQHGPYQNIDDLRKVALLNAEILRKLEPYLIF